ncbi:hypothetical protein B0J17DRAFT_668103 [Rhizoctonia solani]|nr:hypothetical protein B0J17DRAFT_668103 [Rhizoctonia solani]
MKLVDHLFNVQMARYRSRYSLITFPSDATYKPPALPPPVSINLEPVSGAPSDDEMKKVQDAIQTYQELRRFPSLFDAHVNMELSQHLFDLQMARYMRHAGESPPNAGSPVTAASEIPTREERSLNGVDETSLTTNNVGTGSDAIGVQPTSSVDTRELLERSNQLAERFSQLLERSNELVERCNQPSELPSSQNYSELFSQTLERLAHAVEQLHRPAEQPNRLDERFNQLLERFNQLLEQSNQPTQKANELAERSHEFANRANQLAEQLNQSHERSNQLSEQANTTWEEVGNMLGNINKVLMRIQHAIVRGHKGSTISALDCLVNEKGETPPLNTVLGTILGVGFRQFSETSAKDPSSRLPVVIDGAVCDAYLPDSLLGIFLKFYGVGDGIFQDALGFQLRQGTEAQARQRLSHCSISFS